MDIKFHVECPFCHSSIKSDYIEFYQHLPLKCDDCTSEFPIHDVFDMYYSQEPLVQSAIDLLTKYSGRLTLEPHNKSVDIIKNFLQSIDFEKIKTEAIRQMILYGDSYLLIKKDRSDKIIGLELLDPRKTSIKFGAHIKHGNITFREREVSGYIVKNGKSKEHTAEDVVHFKLSRIMSYEDSYGDSLLRIILPILYNYRLTKLVNIPSMRDHFEGSILMGLRVPKPILEAKFTDSTSTKFLVQLFNMEIKSINDDIKDGCEKIIQKICFDKNINEIPEIKLKEPSQIDILIDAGYDMTNELSALAKAVQSGIISPTEFERIKAKFLRRSED